jgi:hypothetical protein
LNQEVIKNVNRSLTSNKIETVTKKLPTKKRSDSDGFTDEFYQTFKGKLTTISSNYSIKYKRKEYYQTHYM